jgi:hypothetical protein
MGENPVMSSKWASLALVLAMTVSTSVLAQDNSSGGATAAAANGGAATQPSAPDATIPGYPTPPSTSPQPASDGPLPAGDEADPTVASTWTPSTLEFVGGAAVAGAIICLAVCGGKGSNTTTTTTTSPK